MGDNVARAVGQGRGRVGRGAFGGPCDRPSWRARGTGDRRSILASPNGGYPFNGDVVIAWDDQRNYGAGVGCKHHDRWGHELAVVTEEALRGGGIARRLSAQAGRRVLAD